MCVIECTCICIPGEGTFGKLMVAYSEGGSLSLSGLTCLACSGLNSE